MIYKFKSKVSGDVIMTGSVGDDVLRLLGKVPAAQGILEAAHMAQAIATLEQAVLMQEQADEQARLDAQVEGQKMPISEGVTLRQRVWPLIEMLKRSASEHADVVWGV
jgi:hypothetical protein